MIMIETAILVCGLFLGVDAKASNLNSPAPVPVGQPSVQVWEGYYRAAVQYRLSSGICLFLPCMG